MFTALRTKLTTPPARVNLVTRSRLTSRLAEGLTRPVTLISAPAGFGKTTLFSEWREREAAADGLPVAWLSLDPSDSSPERFWTYVIEALKTVPALATRASFGAAALAALESRPRPTIDSFLTPLLNDIAASDATFALVLDDYYLAAGPEINEAMSLMLDHLPQGMKVVLLTRTDPGLPFGRLRARGWLCELRADDLRFTLAEAAEFLNQAMACNLPDEDIALLQRRTEGWAAGLQMAALSIRERDDRRSFIDSFTGGQRDIADYLAEEVLARQPLEVQSFLEQTAILERLCGPLCDAVTDRHDGQAMLERIERANLFLVPLDSERRWYRYHQLLSDLLRDRLHRSQPKMAAALHGRASFWYEAEGFSLDAVGHALAAGDYGRVAELSERHALAWWADPSRAFMDSAESAPTHVTVSRPILCVLRGWGHAVQGEHKEAVKLFDIAEQLLLGQPSDSAPTMLRFIDLVRKYIAEMTGQPYEVSEADFETPTLIAEENVAMRNSADTVLSYLVLMKGDLDRAAPLLLAAAERDLRFHSTNAIPIAISRLARLRLAQGRLIDAEALLRKYIETIDGLGSHRFYVNGNLHAVLADVLRERNDLAEASRQADRAVACNEAWGIHHAITLAHHAKARVLAALGDGDGALALINREEHLSLGRHLPSDLTSERQALKIELWLAKGDLAASERWARDSGLTHEDEPTFPREHEYLALARVLLAGERVSEAVSLLARLVAAAAAGRRNGRLIEALVLLSHAQARADSHLAAATLKRALAIAEPEGYVRAFVAPGEPVARLLRLIAVEGRAAGKYAQRILNPAQMAEPDQQVPSSVEPLSGRELEVLGLLAAGMSNRDIAAALTLTVGTVKTHVHSILGKLDAASRTQAIAHARERGLLGD